MHRSGTSVLAKLTELMGAWAGKPEDLLPAHPEDNPTGYSERTDLLIEHDRFLERIGYAWDAVAGYQAAEVDATERERFIARLARIISTLDPAGRPWVLKDPRLCLLIPMWRELLKAPAYVVVVRDPREIAASMHRSHRGGYPSDFLLALWEKYLRAALASLHGERAVFVSYARILEQPDTECERLLDALRSLGVEGLTAIAPERRDAFLDASLKRGKVQPQLPLSAAQQTLHEWLDAQTTAPGVVPVSEFPEALGYDVVLRDHEEGRAHQELHVRREAQGAVIDRLERIEQSLIREQEQLLDELVDQRHNVARLRNDLNNLRKLLDTAKARFLAVERENHGLKEEVDQQKRDLAQADHERGHLKNEVEQVSAHAREREQAIRRFKGSLSWRLTAPLRLLFDLLVLRLPHALERGSYAFYYAIPGISDERKGMLIGSLHKHVPWLTQHTQSYKLRTLARKVHAMREVPLRMQADRAREYVASLHNPPLISILMPVYNIEAHWLRAAIDSVRQQLYPHWELCIADDASTLAETRHVLDELQKRRDPKIKLRRLHQNVGIAGATNAAMNLATGEYVGLLDHDDELARDAVLEMVRRIIDRQPDILYSDEDKLDEDGNHVEPHFKPDFGPDHLLSINYICHFLVLKRDLLERIGGFREGFDGAQDYDLVLRASEQATTIEHIPLVLYHWRKIASSTASTSDAKPNAKDAGRRALSEALTRRKLDAHAEVGPYPTTYVVRRAVIGQPLISILVPFRDQPDLLRQCVESVLDKTTYPHYEIIGIDNGSTDPETIALKTELARRDERVRFVQFDAPFNYSAINNFGASRANGPYLLFLNNDTRVIADQWLGAMLEHAQRPEVGVVGAKLLYEDDTIQHAGVIAGLGGVAGHPYLSTPADHPGYFARAQLIHNLSAVTFACAMTRRDVFEEMGGLNEHDLTVAFNDIDYCLRAREAGYLVVYTPLATLYHLESKSRGYEDNPEKQARFAAETSYMQRRHAAALKRGDPYYNANLSLMRPYDPATSYVSALPT